MNERDKEKKIIRRYRMLRTIRENPDLLKRQRLACALLEHHAEIDNLAQDIKLIMNEYKEVKNE